MDISQVTSATNGFNHASTAAFPKNGEGRAKPASAVQALTDEQQRQVAELKKRDAEVKAHEAAHVAVGGQYVSGGASYSYQSGPDGKRYAVGGEVSIDVSPVSGDPAATIAKMRTIKRAALAPANPSGADQAVAAAATSAELNAQQELMDKRSGKASTPASSTENSETSNINDQKSESSFSFPKTVAAIYAGNSSLNPKLPAFSGNQVLDLIA